MKKLITPHSFLHGNEDNSFRLLLGPRVILAAIVVTFSISLITLFALQYAERHTRERALDNMHSTLNATHSAIKDSWVRGRINSAVSWAAEAVVVDAITELEAINSDKNTLRDHPLQQKLRNYFSERLHQHDALGIFLIDQEFRNLVSMKDSNLGEINLIAKHKKKLLERVFSGIPQFIPPIPSDVPLADESGQLQNSYPTMFIAVPVNNKYGKTIAAFTIRYNPLKEFSSIAQSAQSGRSGETYIFDEEGVMVSESRFDQQLHAMGLIGAGELSILNIEIRDPGVNLLSEKAINTNKKPLTKMVQHALKHGYGESISAYRGYRGVPVLGVWLWDNNLNLGFTTEMDEAEILENYELGRNSILIVLSASFILVIWFVIILNRTHARIEKTILGNATYLDAVLNSVLDAIITINEKGIIESYNQAAEKHFGYSAEEAIGKNVNFLMPEPYHSAHDSYLSNYLTSGTKKIIGIGREVVAQRKDSSTFPIRLAVSETVIDGRKIFIGIVHDISERKLAEEELQSYRLSLEKLVEKRTIKLTEVNDDLLLAKEEAESANHAKSSFLANMSHEIRTPMNAILGYTQILQRDKSIAAEQQDQVNGIYRSGEHLLMLINDILEMSKIEAGKVIVNADNFDLYAMLKDLNTMFKIPAEKKALTLTIDYDSNVPNEIITDEQKLRQILINLLGNAIKFTESGGVSLHVSCTDIEGDEFVLNYTVSDTGVGIAESKLEQIFKPFEQTGKTVGLSGGTGLGLAISYKFAQLVGGNISVNSQINQGSSFCFSVKTSTGVCEEINCVNTNSRVVAVEPSHINMRVLAVDDHPLNLDVLQKLLEPLGFQMKLADSGEKAVEIFQQWPAEIVLMDVVMPGIGGPEAINQIRTLAGGKEASIFIVTASALDEQIQEIKAKGNVDAVIKKPFKIDNLLNVIAKYSQVEYIYESVETASEDLGALNKSMLFSIPEELLEQLRAALLIGDTRQLEQLLEQIEPHAPTVAKKLAECIKNYEFDILMKLLEKETE